MARSTRGWPRRRDSRAGRPHSCGDCSPPARRGGGGEGRGGGVVGGGGEVPPVQAPVLWSTRGGEARRGTDLPRDRAAEGACGARLRRRVGGVVLAISTVLPGGASDAVESLNAFLRGRAGAGGVRCAEAHATCHIRAPPNPRQQGQECRQTRRHRGQRLSQPLTAAHSLFIWVDLRAMKDRWKNTWETAPVVLCSILSCWRAACSSATPPPSSRCSPRA